MSSDPSGSAGSIGPVSGTDKTPARIAGMFDQIAPRYDVLNAVLSGGLDRYWRWRAIRSLGLTGQEALLDVCTGTADVALGALQRRDGAARAVGVDFAGAMLSHGVRKARTAGLEARLQLVRGDAMQLPAVTASVDAVTVAFGIRNVEQPAVACREMLRVLRPGGRLAILEFGLPRPALLRAAYLAYFQHVLPRIGRLVSRHTGAYSYLPQSVGAFPWGEAFAERLRSAGFEDVRHHSLTLGTVYLYTARRPG